MATKMPVIWKKRILVPFWIIRIILMIFIIAIYAWAIKVVHDDPNRSGPSIAAIALFMLFIIIVLLLDILAILLFLRDALYPGTFLTLNSFQTGFWGGVLIMNFVSIARGASAVGIAFVIFVFLTFLALLAYAIVNYRRAKREVQRGNYAPALNPASPHPPASGSYPPAYTNAAPYQDTAYYSHSGAPVELHAPQYQGGGAAADYYTSQPTKPAHMV